jgi:hypothetical protein
MEMYGDYMFACWQECKAKSDLKPCAHPGSEDLTDVDGLDEELLVRSSCGGNLRLRVLVATSNYIVCFTTQERAINGTTAIVAMTNTGYVDYTINLYRSLERLGLHRGLFIFCLNMEAQEMLYAVGITSLLLDDDTGQGYSGEFMAS